MDVAVSELRAHLSQWLEVVRGGDDVVVTDRGLPVARITGLETASLLERLTEQGILGRPVRSTRPVASKSNRVRAGQSLADIVSEQRDEK
jgi:prevent-host-death family protein